MRPLPFRDVPQTSGEAILGDRVPQDFDLGAPGIQARFDALGNVIVTKRGGHPGPTVVVCAHMDEVGFVVKKVEESGLLRFEKLGGHDDRILLAQRVQVRTRAGVLPGVIGTLSAHMTKFDDPNKVRRHSALYIDIGATSRDEALAMGVHVGDPVAWATEYRRVGGTRVIGKSFDDRAGCAAILAALEGLDFSRIHGTVKAVFSVQEEVGLRGAYAAREEVAGDVAIVIDTTAVSDTPEDVMDHTLALGAGPAIKVMDFSLIASVPVRDRLTEVAKSIGIPVQHEVFPGIGTDGGALHMARRGVPTGVISIPTRYAHTPVEMMDLA
ncbi:MAG: M20/M25/M40 family metallo-hydrolase, partial [Firmicutes bacterium]|nr:M20/M25/M40 family metallo-hydrolase [Bacillota bacterium]